MTTLETTTYTIKGMRDSLILLQIGEAGFLTLTRRLESIILIMVGKEDTQNPHKYKMKVNIPSFSGNLDIEFFLDWIYDVYKFFDMVIFPWRNKSIL